MSRFLSDKYRELEPYMPGEQPGERKVIKLNTNESPYPPSGLVLERVREEAGKLNLYCDPECTALREHMAARLGLRPEQLIMTNGSDEALNFAFMAFCDRDHPAIFPDITYGFYPVFARVNQIPFREIPLGDDWRVRPEDYAESGGTIFLANPNAPTGLALSPGRIAEILEKNSANVVVVDEAYVDFGGESATVLLGDYPNLLLTGTFSKSRSLAGMRLGYAAASVEIIQDLKTMQYSTNPYNVDRLAQAAGIACLEEDTYYYENAEKIMKTRSWTAGKLCKLGFEVTESLGNFLFCRHNAFPGSSLRDRLKEKGILIRWFSQERIRNWNRISIGRQEDMAVLIQTVQELLEET